MVFRIFEIEFCTRKSLTLLPSKFLQFLFPFAGNCDITFKVGSKTSHRATVGISIQKKYWNIGIGSAMFKELVKAAEQHNGTEIVDLEFIEGNSRAKALYQKFGFQVVSVEPKFFKLKDGTYQNLVYMQKYL